MRRYTNVDAYAGEFYQSRPSINLNTFINWWKTKPTKFEPSATITRIVQFPDVSFWQGEINYSIMCAQTEAIIIRAGQNLWEDDEFERNYAEAKKCGKKVGAYWFYDDRIDPGRQAVALVSLLIGKKFEMEVFIDWENSYGGGFGGLANVVAMMQLVEKAKTDGIIDIKDVGFYTGYYWFRGHSNAVTNANQYNYLKNKPLWLAWYTSDPSNVLIPTPWTRLTHWQFGTPAVNWGQQSQEIDMNFFDGTKQEFDVRYGETTPPPPEEDMYYELKPNVAGEYRSIRSTTAFPTVPHINGSKIGQINVGSLGKALELDSYTYVSDVTIGGILKAKAGDVWWKVYEANGVTISGWVAEKHLGVTYLTKTLINPTPPPVPVKVHQIDVFSDGKISIDGSTPS